MTGLAIPGDGITMRIPLAPAGCREMFILTLLFGGAACAAAVVAIVAGHAWAWPIALLCGLAWMGGLAFFRDPERTPPGDADALIAPADGRVVETSRLDEHEEIGGPASRISIFLSVFDVHINRSPCRGTVRALRYVQGRFLDARHPDSGRLNESNTIVIEPDDPHVGPIVVRQIAGLIARRIVCDLKVGDRVEAGQRIGLIKFGSRTELIVPAHDAYRPEVAIGDRSRGGETVLARRCRTAASASEPSPVAAAGR